MSDTVQAGAVRLDQVFMFDNENVVDIHYEVWVKDNMGCASMKDTLTIDQRWQLHLWLLLQLVMLLIVLLKLWYQLQVVLLHIW